MSRLCRLKSYKNIGDDGKWAYSEIMQLHRQLAESQAREAEFRDTLKCVVSFGNTGEVEMWRVKEAIALPHDDTALNEYMDAVIEEFVGKFKRHVGGDGEFWMHELEDFYQNTKAP